jgi:hypothetical protein
MAAVPTDPHTLSFLAFGNKGADFIDDARHFVPGNAG